VLPRPTLKVLKAYKEEPILTDLVKLAAPEYPVKLNAVPPIVVTE